MKKMKNSKLYILVFGLLSFFSAKAQDPEYIKNFVQKVIPPSPTAYEMSTYGNLPLNGCSGAFSYNLPIYEVKSGDITIPLTLNYFSTGVEIDKLAGIVGMDWTLNAGGVISRTIKDYPDELGTRWYPQGAIDPMNNIAMIKHIARDDQTQSFYDGEPDWFSFTVNGLSGQFFFDQDLVPHVLSDQRVKISYQISGEFTQFTITDEQGFVYTFGGDDNYAEKTLLLNQCDNWPNSIHKTAWFLKQIQSPQNNIVTFQYASNNFYTNTNLSITASLNGQCPNPTLPSSMQGVLTECISASDIQSKTISNISFDGNSVSFIYNTQRQDNGGSYLTEIKVKRGTQLVKDIVLGYETVQARIVPMSSYISLDTSLNYRLFLKEVTFKGDTSGTNFEHYGFEYYESDKLSRRLSYSKDNFGFNNNSTNSTSFSTSITSMNNWNELSGGMPTQCTANTTVSPSTVHYGMLKKITYPTQGYTKITYEANSDIRTVQNVNTAPSFTFAIYKPTCDNVSASQTKTWVSDGSSIRLNGTITALGNPPCANGIYKIKIWKDNVLFVDLQFPLGTAYNTNSSATCTAGFNNYAPICTVSGSTYKVTISIENGPGSGQVIMDYLAPVITNVDEVFYGPGARVKRVEDVSEGNTYNKRTFYYNQLSEYPSANTSMENYYEPVLYNLATNAIWCKIVPESNACYHWELKPSYTYEFNANGYADGYLNRQGISYSAITQMYDYSNGSNGSIEKIYSPVPASPAYPVLGYEIYGAPSSNYGDVFKDKVTRETVYDTQKKAVKRKKTHYTLLENNYVVSTMARKRFAYPWEDDWTGAYICADTTIVQPLSNYSMWVYKNYYGVLKADTIVEQDFFVDEIVEKVTVNAYGLSPYYQLISQNTTNSLGEIFNSTYQYANQLIGVEQSPYMQQLVDANRIAEPIVIKTYRGSTKLLEKHIKYSKSSLTGNLLLPIAIYTRKGDGNIDISATTDRKLQFTRYDTKGNILEYLNEGDIPVSIIWGYNSQYPIAKIQNALYSSLSSYISSLQTSSNSGTLTQSSFTSLRTAFPNALIETYTYLPLVGPISSISIKEDLTTFEYDDFLRLKFVRDKFGKIVSENNYRFKQ